MADDRKGPEGDPPTEGGKGSKRRQRSSRDRRRGRRRRRSAKPRGEGGGKQPASPDKPRAKSDAKQGEGGGERNGRPRSRRRRRRRRKRSDAPARAAPAASGAAARAPAAAGDGQPADGAEWSFPDEEEWGLAGEDEERHEVAPVAEEQREARDPDGEDVFMHLEDDPALLDGALHNVVAVHVSGAARGLYDCGDRRAGRGDRVVVETDRGLAVGRVVDEPLRQMVARRPPRMVQRLDPDDERHRRRMERQREAFSFCRQRIRERGLPMKLIRVEMLHSGNKALFFFAAENRVDFRELVKDLARRLHMRIEMRQVGVRDESRLSGGIGPCGRRLCCAAWISSFQPVSIRMAKDQNLVLNPAKVSGMCGRLKCCLAYEEQLYREGRKALPKTGQRVRTPQGTATVLEIDIPRQLVRVQTADGTASTFTADDVTPAKRRDT